MRNKSVLAEAEDIQRAVEMIRLGARMQMLESETQLSRERLLKLYKEVRGVSPPKGMLPFSTDWFITWQPNVHSSLFMSFYRFMKDTAQLPDLDAILKAFRLYLDHIEAEDMEEVLSLTRAWTLVRFFDADLLQQATCTCCGGNYVAHAYDPTHEYVCGLCNMPSRAGKGRRSRRIATDRNALV
ncbi:flagellar transcriptional regulator FlhC [Denitromonas sp.]|jgi:flagellar transcriptional activator FlhC|uniref:flagellar transcriptional regulator FlhC n=1 Tax=Denitromonas sp. TaxID=2734609 RepID=UPI002AFFC32D|nr:flagellar transcriptional regulator FlhC [Denitromonas sp.]